MTLEAHIQQVVEQRNAATGIVLMQNARRVTVWMRGYARWKDRTGRARATLQATAVLPAHGGGRERHTEWEFMLWYGVPYGKWLETHRGAAYGHRAGMSEEALMEEANAGSLSVLWPAIHTFWPQISREVRTRRDGIL